MKPAQKLLAKCEILPLQKGASDVSNFDTDFTMEKAYLTPPDKDLLKTMDQGVFRGFSFTNPQLAGTPQC